MPKTDGHWRHETFEEGCELGMSIHRQDVGDMLIRPDDDHAAAVPIYASHVENVPTSFQIGTEHLLVVVEPVSTFPRSEECRHRL